MVLVLGFAKESMTSLPLLGSVPALEEGNWDKDDNRLAAVANLDLKNPGVSKNAAQCPTPLRVVCLEMYAPLRFFFPS